MSQRVLCCASLVAIFFSPLFAAAAERAATRPAQPPSLVKAEGWRASLVASREALFAWEDEQDREALAAGAKELGPWYCLGPIAAKSSQLKDLRNAKAIDLTARYETADGRQITWQRRDDIKDFTVLDFSREPGAGKGAVFFLAREVSFADKTKRKELAFDLLADHASARWQPDGQSQGVSNSLPLRRGTSNVNREEGTYRLYIEVREGAAGKQRFYFAARPNQMKPGAGSIDQRLARRRDLFQTVRKAFDDPKAQLEMHWEYESQVWVTAGRDLDEWLPGFSEEYLRAKYRAAAAERLSGVDKLLATAAGIRAMVVQPYREELGKWTGSLRKQVAEQSDVAELRESFFRAAAASEAIALAARVRSIRMAVDDQRTMFANRYANASRHLAALDKLDGRVAALLTNLQAPPTSGEGIRLPQSAQGKLDLDTLGGMKRDIDDAQRTMLLATPLLAFDKLIVAKGGPGFASNWGGPNRLGNELVVVNPSKPESTPTTLHKGSVSDYDLHWDAKRLLMSDGRVLSELTLESGEVRRVSAIDPPVTHYDACYLPNGKIVCVSDACEQAVPCTGGSGVGNLHILDADGGNERRVSFDQDHDWNPVVMHDGRVLYSRWEYTDLPHYFSRMLFRMNPDGTGQMEYYGSNSYWPNALYWPRPIPGHPTQVVCVVSGHHGVSRVGELVVFDPERGRHEAAGVVQRIPGYGQKVEPVIKDNLVGDVWPRFATPYPLAEPETNLGAGKYFLAAVQNDASATWDLCLVDVFDNITPLLTGGYTAPVPLRPRPMPPEVASHIDLAKKDAAVYLADVYRGDGLRGYPRGSIKALRIGTHHYRYPGNGDTRASSYEGGWDVKRILGTVPVHEDGSAFFRVPANTPIFVQPLDEEGKAQQQMRSWYSAMPGEVASCVGCHEQQNSGPPTNYTLASRKHKPDAIEPWLGPVRGVSFNRDVQPVLDRRCVGCHDGQADKAAGKTASAIDLRAKRLHPDFSGPYSPAYMALQKYVRRAGYESDNHMHAPAEFEADTSVLVQMLKKGHYNVSLTGEEWQRLYTWIDYNVPYAANWRESHRPPKDEQVAQRAKYKKLFANIDDKDEEPLELPPIAAFEPPPAAAQPAPVKLDGWPLSAEQAAALQQAAGKKELELPLAEGIAMKCVLIPAGRFVMGDVAGFADEQRQAAVTISRPFYLGTLEVTNSQYKCFDSRHDSAYMDGRGKDRTTRGTPVNQPEQPVIRVSWHEAMAFCRWLSERTGQRCSLPTEAEWEWAARAGAETPLPAGAPMPDNKPFANLADGSIAGWNYGRCEPGYNDGQQYSVQGGKFPANAWGLFDMHGNVAEWCQSVYRPYPYRPDDARDDPRTNGLKVVRGGSWNDTLRFATSASRWRYQPHQPVYNVGFRVRVEPAAPAVAASP